MSQQFGSTISNEATVQITILTLFIYYCFDQDFDFQLLNPSILSRQRRDYDFNQPCSYFDDSDQSPTHN